MPHAQKIVVPLKNSAEDVIRKRISDISIDIWNLSQRWESISVDGAAALQRIANNRTKLNKDMFAADEILVDAERLCFGASFLHGMAEILNKIQRANEMLPALSGCVDGLKLDSPSSRMLKLRVEELRRVVPALACAYEAELRFKYDSIDEFSCSESTDVNSIIVSSWNNAVYVDSSLLSSLYSLVI